MGAALSHSLSNTPRTVIKRSHTTSAAFRYLSVGFVAIAGWKVNATVECSESVVAAAVGLLL